MTICLATICDQGRAVIAASDRMITAEFLALEFEHPDSKIDRLAETCIGVTAGDALANTELFRACRAAIAPLQSPSIESIAQEVRDQFVKLRRQRAEDEILTPRGMTFDEFYSGGLINRLPSDLADTMDRGVQQNRYPLSIIISGVDNGRAHIYGVEDPGVLQSYDRLGYHAIGSGLSHALLTLIDNRYSNAMNLNQAMYLVYEAKRRAELAQGVGESTELAIISQDGTRQVTNSELDELESIYQKKTAPQLQQVQEAISQLPFQASE